MTFNEYAEQRGMKLMREDIRFIQRLIFGMEKDHRREVLTEYANIWVTTRDATERSVAAQNAARFASNTYLRGIASGEIQDEMQESPEL